MPCSSAATFYATDICLLKDVPTFVKFINACPPGWSGENVHSGLRLTLW